MINQPSPTETEEFDPYASASDPVVQNFDLFGQVEINAWACALVKGTGKVPFDPTNPNHKRFTAIDVFIQPLLEIDVKYPKSLECHWLAEFAEWAKITLPSIKAAGIANVREINGKWARVARVPNGKKYEKKDKATGQPTGEFADETTFKFVAIYDTEDACRAAYLANGGTPSNGHVAAEIVTSLNNEKDTNFAFLKVIVSNAARGKTDLGEAKDAVGVALLQYPTVAKYFTVDSDETIALINEAMK